MESRDQRVSQGGLFHSHKVQYSKETQNLLHRLLEESKLSILQRQTLKESVQRGEPLPGPRSCSARSRSDVGLRRAEVLVPAAPPRRRSYQAIVRSGAYQREAFDPPFNSNMKDREAEKQKLQSLMTYGKNAPPEPLDLKSNNRLRQKIQEDESDSQALFDHLVQEIKERLEFLQEMESLGQGKAYQTVIEQEIAAKMRQLAKMDQEKFLQMGMNLKNIGCESLRNGKLAKQPKSSEKTNVFPYDE